jgi:hypothetical protein
MRHPLYRLLLLCLVSIGFLRGSVLTAQAQDTPDPRAAKLLVQLAMALSSADEKTCIEQLLPILHKSLLASAGDDLAREVKALTLKKARTAISKYASPISIARIEKTPTPSVGMGATAEQGAVYEYFLRPKDNTAISAPVKIFFPANGGEPKISHFGSL